jgi:tRNA(Ile)-lysidine synthase TilS/MesJ/sulfur carrier protein ThiS
MPSAVYRDKLGRIESLPLEPGQPLVDVLRQAGIPLNSVITRVNGSIVPEQTALVGPDDHVEISQVRHYDLSTTRRPATRTYGTPDPVYVKSVLFDDEGELEVRAEQLDGPGFARYVEETFVQSVRKQDLLAAGDHVLIGLSGGRDSVAFLKLLERTQERLPDFGMTAVTITGLPDWEEPATYRSAIAACELLGIDQQIVTAEEIEEVFHLSRPFAEAMNSIVAGEHASKTMVIGHQVLRRMLERAAEAAGATKIAWGFNADDLVASLVVWFTGGFRMGGIPIRDIGSHRFVFPLYRITKKELTLYLELQAPDLNRQGTPGRFTSGPGERSLAYALADHLYALWPGVDYYLFRAFENMQRYMFPLLESECGVCGGTYLLQEGVDNPVELCDVCAVLSAEGLVRPV